MSEDRALAERSPISRRTLIGAAVWSVPVIALAVAAPAHAASGGALDASGVVLTFTGPQWSSEFALSGQLSLSPVPSSPVDVTATITWQGTGANAGAEGLYLYKGNIPGGDAGIIGWTLRQGAPDDQLHRTFVFGTIVAAGTAAVPTVSSYDGDTTSAFMFGAETPNGGSAFWDGIITIRFSAPGFADAVLATPYVQDV
ncbi:MULTISPECIES: hypothetical protein [unclassified Microbacterium]|uniref:hypothetical protein n=1 Tax=unclassified Microbacterium TaxID=2609290 RepID=UPI0016053611|nr:MULTISPECIES: hypothetical protein [unclassified Microbacterium]QNA92467.1 hypothetical protein G4G29_08975 [Microbacterium sp. Se63.02b]QYM65765.1 hypothetical protein K1X59_09015 [Microbacterium sp. Se5.02b]